MTDIHISRERVIQAPPGEVYACIADYRHHHPNFLPPAFSDVRVEEGGIGAGTVVRFRLKAGGRTREYEGHVEEPEPGRVLTETYADGTVTSFTVTPCARGSRVRIDTRTSVPGGLQGWVVQKVAPRLLLPIYKDELTRLDVYARTQPVR